MPDPYHRIKIDFKDPVKPVNGTITVPTAPGMGVELDEAKIDSEREFTVD